jgi:3-acetyloctanal aminotransferase
MLPRFVFLVHALTPLHRRVMAVRTLRPGLFLGRRDGSSQLDVAELARVRLAGVAEGVVIGVPMTPQQLLEDQQRAVARLEHAAGLVPDVRAVGLGSLCAVVGGRGEALAERLSVPVTTGGAATAWALVENARAAWSVRGGPVAVLGSAGPVGGAVARLLAAGGLEVRVDSRRAARGLDLLAFDSAEEAVAGCLVVVGAGTTGLSLQAAALRPGSLVVDVALPHTPIGRLPDDVRLLAGEAVSLPPAYQQGGWGALYHLLAGYGPRQVYACLVEPLVLATSGRTQPFAIGRRVLDEDVLEFGAAATALGFRPRLAVGWFQVGVDALRLGRAQAALPGPSEPTAPR